jgi:hypothetical protein
METDSGGFRHAKRLAAFIKSRFGFAGRRLPPRNTTKQRASRRISPTFAEGRSRSRVLSQLGLDSQPFFRFVERAREVGIDVRSFRESCPW